MATTFRVVCLVPSEQLFQFGRYLGGANIAAELTEVLPPTTTSATTTTTATPETKRTRTPRKQTKTRKTTKPNWQALGHQKPGRKARTTTVNVPTVTAQPTTNGELSA